MSKILIMGGSRFIGKHLLRKLAQEPHEILVINRGSVPNADYLPEGAEHIALDRNDADAMKQALAGKSFDLVFDVSGITGEHTQILLDSLESPPGRHIHVSSGSVYDIYGEDPPIFNLPIAEDFPIGRIHEDEHPYMNAKRGGEKVLFDAHTSSNYPMVIVRPTFVYGPDNYIYREAYFFDRIEHDRPVILPGKGHGYQDLVFVEDLADLLIDVSQRDADQVVGQAFNGTKGDVISGRMYAKAAAKVIGKEVELLYIDLEEIQEMQWPPQLTLYPYIPEGGSFHDARKIEQQLGFVNQHSYQEGLEKAYLWWKQHGEKREYSELEQKLVAYIRAKGTETVGSARSELNEVLDAEKAKIEAQNQTGQE